MLVALPTAATADPDPLYPFEQLVHLYEGSQQASAIEGADQTSPFGAHPGLMPDWNHDGVFGNPPDFAIENSPRDATAPFRYPCIAVDGRITYRTSSGTCAPEGTVGALFRQGEARKLRLADSMGWEVQAAIFLPGDALEGGSPKLPGVVFANGARGMIVLNFDFAGQGQSEDGGPGASRSTELTRRPPRLTW